MTFSGWIGVDLDGTLAFYGGTFEGGIGDPVPLMLERVKRWLEQGADVRIFTARVAENDAVSPESGRVGDSKFIDEQRLLIAEWCEKHLGRILPVTCQKDYAMIELWDDRAVQVEMNTGRRIDGKGDEAKG